MISIAAILSVAVSLAAPPLGGHVEPLMGPKDKVSVKPLSKRVLAFDVPHTIATVQVPGDMEANGIPLQLRAYQSTDNVDELISYFQTAFTNAELFILPDNLIPHAGWGPEVVGYDSEARMSYVVFFQENADGTTTVILGRARLAERKDTSKDGAIAPVFPGSTEFIQTNVEAARVLSYKVAAVPEEVGNFYRTVLLHNGYDEPEPGFFRTRDHTLRVQVDSLDNGKSSVLVLKQFTHPDSSSVAQGGKP